MVIEWLWFYLNLYKYEYIKLVDIVFIIGENWNKVGIYLII